MTTDPERALDAHAITHDDGTPCTAPPCTSCGDTDMCACDLIHCESCDAKVCHDCGGWGEEDSTPLCSDHLWARITINQELELLQALKAAYKPLDPNDNDREFWACVHLEKALKIMGHTTGVAHG